MRKYIWIVDVFYSVRSESTHTSQGTIGNKRVTIDICTTHKPEWLSFSSWSILWHSLPNQRKKKCCPLSEWLQNKSLLHRMSFGNHKKQTARPIAMGWPPFSCMSRGAELAWMPKGVVVPYQRSHCHGQGGVTVWLPTGLLQGAFGAGWLGGSMYPRWAQHRHWLLSSSLPLTTSHRCFKGSLLTAKAIWQKLGRQEGLKRVQLCRIC